MNTNAVAIITARGGSKRIPKKNIKLFLGTPIIEYSIKAARDAGIFDEVMVSTDDEAIAAVATKAGATVPFMRSAHASSDVATTAQVLEEVLAQYGAIQRSFAYGCCIYPTAPFVTAEKLKKAYQYLRDKGADTVIPVTQFSFPIWRSFRIDNERIAYNWPENALRRSQDLPPAYHDCGQFYFFRTDKFLIEKRLVTDNTMPIVVPESEVQDIDTPEDWKIAEIKYSFLQQHGAH